MNSQSLARGLAFFSFGLGLAELLAPRQVARAVGINEDDNETLLRLFGVRELGSGIGIMQGNTATFLWSRVAGDAIDLATLARALNSPRSNRRRVVAAMSAVAGVTVLDTVAALLLSRNPAEPDWRITRSDRGGLLREDPVQARQHADSLMAAHESGHWRTDGDLTHEREETAVRAFAPGD